MIERAFTLLLEIAAAYAGCGLLLAVVFLAQWCKTFDPSAAGGTWGFRALIVPGVVALWPVILVKVFTMRRGNDAETPIATETLRHHHGFAFIALAILGPLLFVVALIWRAPEIPRSGARLAADPHAPRSGTLPGGAAVAAQGGETHAPPWTLP